MDFAAKIQLFLQILTSFWSLFFVVEYFRQFFINGVTTQVSGDDGAVGAEEDDFRDAGDAVSIGGNLLRVNDLRVGQLLFLDGFLRLVHFCVCQRIHTAFVVVEVDVRRALVTQETDGLVVGYVETVRMLS